jgi:2-polyprenyl-6-methoxyphenol hydroxylase-like FAD-dependent oxidoreductase
MQKRITVYDRLEEPPSPTDESVWSDVAKFYLIGLGGRGQGALREFGVWDEVEKVCTATVGRRDWSPESSKEGMERIFTDRPVTTQVLPRDKLVGVMYQHILKNYANQIDLKFGCEVTPLDFESGNDGTDVVVQVAKCKEIDRQNSSAKLATSSDPVSVLCDTENVEILTTKFLVAADGSARAFANAMEEADKQRLASMNPIQRLFAGKPFTVTRYVDDNQRIYKTVPFRLPEGWRPDLNYSARSKGSRITFDALPANRNGSYNGVLLVKKEDELAQEDMDPTRLREAFDEFLPQFSHLIDDETINVVAKKPPSYLPAFRYVSPRLYQGKRTVVLGDCIHTVKPYFGLGANSALEDVQVRF